MPLPIYNSFSLLIIRPTGIIPGAASDATEETKQNENQTSLDS